MDALPFDVSTLIDELLKENQRPLPRPETVRDKIMWDAGRRDLVEKLRRLRDQPQEDGEVPRVLKS